MRGDSLSGPHWFSHPDKATWACKRAAPIKPVKDALQVSASTVPECKLTSARQVIAPRLAG
jgi:hypothetical protein